MEENYKVFEWQNPEKLDVFLIEYKNFKNMWGLGSECYKIVSNNDIENESCLRWIKYDTYDDPIFEQLGHAWYEMDKMYSVWKQWDFKKYVGFVHPRQYFELDPLDPDLDVIFDKYDIIVPAPVYCVPNVFEHYQTYQRIEDLADMINILLEMHPEYEAAAEEVMGGQAFYRCNTFIMKSDDYKKYAAWLFPLLIEFMKSRGFENEQQVFDFVKEHYNEYGNSRIPYESHFNTVQYLAGFIGHLSERLFNIYVKYNFEHPYFV